MYAWEIKQKFYYGNYTNDGKPFNLKITLDWLKVPEFLMNLLDLFPNHLIITEDNQKIYKLVQPRFLDLVKHKLANILDI